MRHSLEARPTEQHKTMINHAEAKGQTEEQAAGQTRHRDKTAVAPFAPFYPTIFFST